MKYSYINNNNLGELRIFTFLRVTRPWGNSSFSIFLPTFYHLFHFYELYLNIHPNSMFTYHTNYQCKKTVVHISIYNSRLNGCLLQYKS